MISQEHFMWFESKHEHLHKNFINYLFVKQNHNENIYLYTDRHTQNDPINK